MKKPVFTIVKSKSSYLYFLNYYLAFDPTQQLGQIFIGRVSVIGPVVFYHSNCKENLKKYFPEWFK